MIFFRSVVSFLYFHCMLEFLFRVVVRLLLFVFATIRIESFGICGNFIGAVMSKVV